MHKEKNLLVSVVRMTFEKNREYAILFLFIVSDIF